MKESVFVNLAAYYSVPSLIFKQKWVYVWLKCIKIIMVDYFFLHQVFPSGWWRSLCLGLDLFRQLFDKGHVRWVGLHLTAAAAIKKFFCHTQFWLNIFRLIKGTFFVKNHFRQIIYPACINVWTFTNLHLKNQNLEINKTIH